MCSNVDSQCVSNTITVSGRRRSRHSDLIRSSPGTSVISLPWLISSRTSAGSMIVGTCATRAAPTTSPICTLHRRPHSRWGVRTTFASLTVLPPAPPWRRTDVLHVRVEVEAVHAAFAADTRRSRAAERRTKVANEEAVHPHRPCHETGGNAIGALPIARVQDRRQPVFRLVRERDRLLLVLERLQREDRAEHLLAEYLGAGRHVDEERRAVVQPAQILVRSTAEDGLCALRLRSLYEPVHALDVLAGDLGPDVGRLVPRVALYDRARGLDEPVEELVVHRTLDEQSRARQADLSRVVEPVHGLLHRRRHVRIGERDERRLTAELQRDGREILRRGLGHDLPGLDGAGERDSVHAGMAGERR